MKHKFIWILAALLCICTLFSACSSRETPEAQVSTVRFSATSISLKNAGNSELIQWTRKCLNVCTNISLARFDEYEYLDEFEMYYAKFTNIESYHGSLRDNQIIAFVPAEKKDYYPFEKGKTYLLPLRSQGDVNFVDFELFGIDNLFIPIDNGKPQSVYITGIEVDIDFDQIEDVIDFAQEYEPLFEKEVRAPKKSRSAADVVPQCDVILKVKIDYRTREYSRDIVDASVLSTIHGEAPDKIEIYTVSDSLIAGREYIVCLDHVFDDSYTIAAPKNAWFDANLWNDAKIERLASDLPPYEASPSDTASPPAVLVPAVPE